ncbi:peptide chain release factor 3 [Pelagicoccus sp. SDUM812002]|uniref:peptide chain release factor 3 n=1 Tax=Pelagicoccus sp. SDUM812002 TaxID=3041266 RepID=UPI00280F44DE|nr:peptide chain release factor 3 [Pelagicoccus sp. SDUM812002]MDQ8184946.1 peptide chain release factor 3 [Pelagicoccus sp. SDUM812002]
MTQLEHQTRRRRTFAIISHPDAGKTTLTEKLLLYGGAKDQAGSVRDRKHQSETTSDWLELEKQRGISVSSTAMQFEYADHCINIVDTPGHRDFSEDTYRVLTAVDAAIMVLDLAKGIETQTLKLFEVCRSRHIPIVTFVNKCDRPGKDPLAILDEIEETLSLQTYCANWPIGSGPAFQGLYDRYTQSLHRFDKNTGGRYKAPVQITSGDRSPELPESLASQIHDAIGLLDLAGHPLDEAAIATGKLTPVYFGSAVNNFGIQLLLEGFLRHAPPPQPRKAGDRQIDPLHPAFSATVFKIQANMDPNHRDRLAFLRVCSGQFRRELRAIHAQTGKPVRLSFAHKLFGRDRETQEEAWPGDILGITGQSDLDIGDTITEDPAIRYDPIPRFAPEAFAYFRNSDTRSFKRFRAGIDQLLQEKVAQRFHPLDALSNAPLLGSIGSLQFDVARYRLQNEYDVECRVETAPWSVARWVHPDHSKASLRSLFLSGIALARDDWDNLALLFESQWKLEYFQRNNDAIRLASQPWS